MKKVFELNRDRSFITFHYSFMCVELKGVEDVTFFVPAFNSEKEWIQ